MNQRFGSHPVSAAPLAILSGMAMASGWAREGDRAR